MERTALIALPTLLAIATPALAQERETLVWLSADAEMALDRETGVGIETQMRFGPDGHYETILGVMATTKFGRLEMGAGYQHNRSVDRVPGLREHRLRQQVGFPIATFAGGRLSGRLRAEERVRNDGDDVHFRLRPRMQYVHPLGRGGARWSLSHESFLGTRADWTDQHGLFRMRNAIAVDVPLGGAVRGSVGYLNQTGFGRDGAGDTMDHVVTAGASMAF